MKLQHRLPEHSVESIEFIPEGNGESGFMIWLNDGFSFDPMANDYSRFIPADALHEALELIVFTTPAAKT
jgi:hypothetical protein